MTDGINQLNERRARRTRQAPPPRHPKASAEAFDLVTDPQQDDTTAAENTDVASADTGIVTSPADPPHARIDPPAPARPMPQTIAPPAPPALRTGEAPRLDVDLNDPIAHVVSPTVMSIPSSLAQRFKDAADERGAPTHTGLVLDALRQNLQDLPSLVLNRRPGAQPGDLFPWRATPGSQQTETPMPVRIRPTKGELAVMGRLEEWVNREIEHARPGDKKTNRSEMVAAALDAYLPPLKGRKK